MAAIVKKPTSFLWMPFLAPLAHAPLASFPVETGAGGCGCGWGDGVGGVVLGVWRARIVWCHLRGYVNKFAMLNDF